MCAGSGSQYVANRQCSPLRFYGNKNNDFRRRFSTVDFSACEWRVAFPDAVWLGLCHLASKVYLVYV